MAGNECVLLGDEAIQTADGIVRTTEDTVSAPVITSDTAAGVLLDAFGPLVDAEYLQGKTLFRDALCIALELSQVDAEALIDGLEAAGQIRFVETEEGLGWQIEA